MSQFSLPDSPTGSRFGWPAPKRLEEFAKLQKVPNLPTSRVVLQGKSQDLPIIRVPINLPKYRMENGRTASGQEEYLATHAAVRSELFTGDPELLDAQEVQHELLTGSARQAGLLEYFKNPANKQVEPILLDENGFVVNGNRRLATWRQLLANDSKLYGHFAYIDVVVLPHCDQREINRLEASLQIQKDIKADYSWDSTANMMLQKEKRDGFSEKDIAELYGMKESEVRDLIDMRNYAADYLRSRGKENHWSLVSDAEYAFKRIVAGRSKLSNAGEQELFKQAAYILVDSPKEAGGRLWDAIPGIHEYIGMIKEKLQDHYSVEPPQPDEGLDDLFGGAVHANPDTISIPLAAVIQKPENAEEARKIIVEVIESQKQLDRDVKAEKYLLDQLARVQALLAATIKDGLRPDSKRKGVAQQVEIIRTQLGKIEKWLNNNA